MPLRTIVYVDGFNLYYGALRGTPWKWLDLRALAGRLLPRKHDITAIKYFTAPVDARPDDPQKPLRQQMYIRALGTIRAHVVEGHYLTHRVRMRLAAPAPGQYPFVEVIKTEEKGSDVNIACHLLLDAARDRMDCAVLVTGDSDLKAPVQMAIREFGKTVGVLNPQKIPCRTLQSTATFYKHIRRSAIAASQFPPTLVDAQGPFAKPADW